MHRLFLGLELPQPILDTCFAMMEDGPAGWAWQDETQLHLTLRFVGEVGRREANDIADALLAMRSSGVQIGIEGSGWFDHGPRGALFARAAPRPPLERLHAKLDRMLVGLGHPPERRAFLPHITLARRRTGADGPADWLRREAGRTVAPEPVAGVTLFESVLGKSGAHYIPIVKAPLPTH